MVRQREAVWGSLPRRRRRWPLLEDVWGREQVPLPIHKCSCYSGCREVSGWPCCLSWSRVEQSMAKAQAGPAFSSACSAAILPAKQDGPHAPPVTPGPPSFSFPGHPRLYLAMAAASFGGPWVSLACAGGHSRQWVLFLQQLTPITQALHPGTGQLSTQTGELEVEGVFCVGKIVQQGPAALQQRCWGAPGPPPSLPHVSPGADTCFGGDSCLRGQYWLSPCSSGRCLCTVAFLPTLALWTRHCSLAGWVSHVPREQF